MGSAWKLVLAVVLVSGCTFADGGNDLTRTSELAAGSTKVDICHVPPGNPANAHTINVSVNALAAHLAHGDTEGACDAGGCSSEAECCLEACLESQCALCEGDPDCLAECGEEICGPICPTGPPCEELCETQYTECLEDAQFPDACEDQRLGCIEDCGGPSGCDQLCMDQAAAYIEGCESSGEPICPEDPGADCLAESYEVYAECLELECAIDGCPARCVGSCIADCNDEVDCQNPELNLCLLEPGCGQGD